MNKQPETPQRFLETVKWLGTAPAEHEASEQGEPDDTDDGRERIGLHRAAGANRLLSGSSSDRGTFVADEVGGLVQARFGDRARLLRELAEVILGEVTRFHRAGRNRLRDAARFSFIDAIKPGHG
jgi:hypothetical protein